ncbi:MAG: ABC transporter permease subunit [Pseudomonadota bacterium]
MTTLAPSIPRQGAPFRVAILLLFAGLLLWGRDVLPWAFDYPKSLIPPFRPLISGFIDWLLNDASFGLFTFRDMTRAVAAVVDAPYRVVLGLLSAGIGPLPALPWVVVTALAALMGHRAGGVRLALLVAACFMYLALFGQWASAMVTLASILIAVPIGVAGGLALGLAAFRHPRLARAMDPLLDLMQTMPVFAYLVPILILFGFGPTAAIVATVIFAMPPMIRGTWLALARVPDDIRDLGVMVGCTETQMTWRVLLPVARPGLMVGVNQVIMQSLNMVIIASMIGAGGLGFDVLAALRRLDFGAGVEAGFAIVALAVVLDRVSQAAAAMQVGGKAGGRLWPLAVGILGLGCGLAYALPALHRWPEGWYLSTGAFWGQVVEYININHFDQLEGVKNALLTHVLVPTKRALTGLPWLGVAVLLAGVGWRVGGARLALLAGGLTLFIAATGLWEQAMITVYLCGLSTIFAMVIGLPVGILAAGRPALWRIVRLMIDTAQTLPSFVYLMPAVMLFRVGDFTALLAVVAYAVVPAIRYTALGLQGVDARLVEAARAMGCTGAQIMRLKLRLALPELLLGLNQTILFALSMLVITALVGTRDLGQEVYIALTKADAGRGLVAGLCVAAIAIIADRLIRATAARASLGTMP